MFRIAKLRSEDGGHRDGKQPANRAHACRLALQTAPCIYLAHRRPEAYPDPERFQPERFLEQSPGTYTWIPFGGGTRRCIGAAFAQFEMEVVLRELIARRGITPARPEDEPVLRRAITETPARDTEVVLAPTA